MKNTIRTPENRFENLEGYDFSSHYMEAYPSQIRLPMVVK